MNMRYTTLVTAGLCVLSWAVEVCGQTEAPREKLPLPLTHYRGREIAPYMTYHGAPWLLREEREAEERTSLLLKELALQPGQAVCDLGCGNGYLTFPMARAVGEKGLVYAVDIQPEMLRLLQERARMQELKNVRPVLGTPIDPRLPENSLDLILLVDVYHEFSYPEQMLQAMRKALKPKGRIALVEFRAEDPNVPIRPLHKMSKDQILKEYPPNGFRLAGQYDGLPWQHLMYFERDDAPREPGPAAAAGPAAAEKPQRD